jgi:hypothetical protein
MAEHKDREHFIPIPKHELVDLLCAEKGLTPGDRGLFQQFCRLVEATFHFEYHQRLEQLKKAYTPFDPDRDTKSLAKLGAADRQKRLDDLFRDVAWLLERANFKHLSRADIQAAAEGGASDWGVNMDVDFNVFERLEVFCRGDALGERTRRGMFAFWRKERVQVPTYQRLVMILKLRQHKRLGKYVNTESVYLKLFKDIPKLDLEMLLPGGRLQMPRLQRGKLGVSVLSTVGWIGYKIASDLGTLLTVSNPLVFWGPLSLVFGYGYRQYYGYQSTKQTYSLQLTESLYYQNLDNNGGVLTRLLDDAEEQECREAMLAYFFLWRYAGEQGWTAEALDDYVELYLEGSAGLKVDFEIGDAMAKLERMRIVTKDGDRYRAVPIDKALEMLDWTWDNYFKYANPDQEAPPVP